MAQDQTQDQDQDQDQTAEEYDAPVAFECSDDPREIRGFFARAEILAARAATATAEAIPERVIIVGVTNANGAKQLSVRATNRAKPGAAVTLRPGESAAFLAAVGRDNLAAWNAAMRHAAGKPMAVLTFGGAAGVTLTDAEAAALVA